MKTLSFTLKKSFILLIVITCSNFSFAQTTINPDTVCVGAIGEVYSVDDPSGTAGSTYNWTISVASGGNITGGQGTNSITVDWGLVPGLYPDAVTVVETSVDGCIGIPVTLDVEIIDAVLLAIGPFCEGDPAVALTGTPTGGTYTGTGVVGGSFDPTVSGVGTFVITYTIAGCSATINAVVNPNPVTGPIFHN